jgi:hypothetical protein
MSAFSQAGSIFTPMEVMRKRKLGLILCAWDFDLTAGYCKDDNELHASELVFPHHDAPDVFVAVSKIPRQIRLNHSFPSKRFQSTKVTTRT